MNYINSLDAFEKWWAGNDLEVEEDVALVIFEKAFVLGEENGYTLAKDMDELEDFEEYDEEEDEL